MAAQTQGLALNRTRLLIDLNFGILGSLNGVQSMTTLGWDNIKFAETPGLVRFRELLVSIGPEHIARWKDDPDGRFQLKYVSAGTAELEKFYPSL